MLGKLKTAAGLLTKAASRPGIVFIAVRERGWRNVFTALWRAQSDGAAIIVHDLQSRMAPTPENLSAWYPGTRFLPVADQHLFRVRIASGEEFLIRRSRGWQDLGTLYEVFIEKVYANHPPIAGKTVLDIGANIGDTAVYFASRGARVIAYEPDPEMCQLARLNVAGNGLAADIRNAGVGGTNETLRLSATCDGADTLSRTLFAGTPADTLHPASLPIRVIAFADVLRELDSIDLLKIDCQGCEYPSLQSLTTNDLRRIEHVMMEYHGESGELADKLRAAGFSVRLKGRMYLYADRY